MAWLAVLMVLALGIANQRGSTCAVSAADEVIASRSAHRLAGFLVAAMVSAGVLAALGSAPRQTAAIGLGCIAGGVIGAIGASLNGRCAMGTIASLGRGRLDRLATLAGFYCGARLVLHGGEWHTPLATLAPRTSPLFAAAALALAAVAWWLARDRSGASPAWMALIGLLNALLLWLMADWSYTGGLTRLAAGGVFDMMRFWLYLGALISGSIVAAAFAGTVQLRPSGVREWLQSGLGGLFLGAGSAVVPGSNDAMLLVGVPLLVPGLLLAYLAFWMTLIALRGLRYRLMTREPGHASL